MEQKHNVVGWFEIPVRDMGRTLLYFTAHSGDLANELSRVTKAGGKVLQEKKLITEDVGYAFRSCEARPIRVYSSE